MTMNIAMILMTNNTLLSTTCSLVDQHERLHCINNPETGKEGARVCFEKVFSNVKSTLAHEKHEKKLK